MLNERSGADLTTYFADLYKDSPGSFELGIRGGQHSGVEDCVMRYDIANTYKKDGEPNTRYYWFGRELPGAQLCSQSTGTSINAPGRTPQPRYFDAARGRGNCKGQILVNDAINAQRR